MSKDHRHIPKQNSSSCQNSIALQKAQMHERAGVLREEVLKIIKDSNDSLRIVDIIITLQRLSLDHHYEDEINELLNVVYRCNFDNNDLHEVSRRFYVLRNNGYNVSSGETILY